MRFPLRTLLILVTVVALGLAAWRSHQNVEIARVRLNKLRNEIASEEQSLWVGHPMLHSAILNAGDEFSAIRQLRERCDDAMESLRE